MASDRPIGGPFRLSDLPGWTEADELAALNGALLGKKVLEPTQAALGPLTILSWYRPGAITVDNNVSAHASGSAVDLRLAGEGGEAGARRLFNWIWDHLTFGELLLERPGSHGRTDWLVHVSLPGVGGFGQVLEETADGGWGVPGFGGSGSSSSPIPLPGLDVTVEGDRQPGWLSWGLLALLLLGVLRA